MKHELPKLPWQADALTGAISATTIDFHYGKHTRTYLENVDKLAAETPLSESATSHVHPEPNNAAPDCSIFVFSTSTDPKHRSTAARKALSEAGFGDGDSASK